MTYNQKESKASFNMAFMQYPSYIIFSLTCCFISLYIYNKLRTRNSSMPINWPLLGMTPSMFWNFNRFHDHITDILKKNGGTFMFKGPWFANLDMLITSDPANYQYISSTNFHNYPRGQEVREILDIFGDGIFSSDSLLWKLHHKTTMSLFNHAKFKILVEKTTWNDIHKKLVPVLDYMSERGLKTDLQNIFQRLTLDVIMKLLSDYDPETLSIDLPYNAFDEAVIKSEETLLYRHFLPKFYWKLLNLLQIGREKHLTDASKLCDELLYRLIKEKKEKIDDLSLISGFMREYKDHPSNNPSKFIRDTLLNIMFAGRDTTSSALTWFFYLLAKHPLVEGKIHEEIHARLGMKEGEKWNTIGAKELEKLVYLHGALYEALRLFPPVPANPKVPHEADTLPSGHQVHPSNKVILHSYAMGRMETIWGQDCLKFIPERWLSKQGGIKHATSNKFTAYHSGPRACLGKEMSLTQMRIVAITIIYNYHVEAVEGHPVIQDPSVILKHKYGFMVKLTKRN